MIWQITIFNFTHFFLSIKRTCMLLQNISPPKVEPLLTKLFGGRRVTSCGMIPNCVRISFIMWHRFEMTAQKRITLRYVVAIQKENIYHQFYNPQIFFKISYSCLLQISYPCLTFLFSDSVITSPSSLFAHS